VYELLGAGNRNWFRILPERRIDKKTFITTIRASETCHVGQGCGGENGKTGGVVEVRNAKTRVRQRECFAPVLFAPAINSREKT